MDLSPLTNQIFSVFWILIPLLIFVSLLKTAWFKGKAGEAIVNLFFKLFLSNNKYHLLKNVTLPTYNGTTQIDHIIVSRFGIFVVETKNMKGWIFGSSNQRNWTQKIYHHTNKFQNPLRQNYKHIKAIEELLNINPETIFSVIVFTGNATIKTNMPDNVTYPYGCIKYIRSKKSIILDDKQVSQIIININTAKFDDNWRTHHKHVSNLKSSSNNSCPNCGSEMVIRIAKRGQNAGAKFWGCSKYPKCKGTFSIN